MLKRQHPTQAELFEYTESLLAKRIAFDSRVARHLTSCVPCRDEVDLIHNSLMVIRKADLLEAGKDLQASVLLAAKSGRRGIRISSVFPRTSLARGVGPLRAAPNSVGLPRMYVSLPRCPSAVIGVGHLPRAFAALPLLLPPSSPVVRGVGHNKDAVAPVRGAHVERPDACPLRIKPECGQVAKYVGHSPRKETWDVLHEHESRSYQANESSKLGPEPAFVILPQSLPREAHRLAREPAGDEIGTLAVIGRHLSHVRDAPHVGPVLGENPLAVVVDLHL